MRIGCVAINSIGGGALTPIGLPYMDGNMLFQAVLGVTPECRNWVCSYQYSIGIS